MKQLFLPLIVCVMFTASCSLLGTNSNTTANSNAANTNSANAEGNTATVKTTPTIDPNYQATFPFKEFPAVETTAKAGEVVLVPSYLRVQPR